MEKSWKLSGTDKAEAGFVINFLKKIKNKKGKSQRT
jgi:hypothetical protein